MGNRDTFGQWLDGYGLSRLAADFTAQGQRLTRQAVYQWREGETVPRPQHALRLVELSRGALTLDAIYQPRTES